MRFWTLIMLIQTSFIWLYRRVLSFGSPIRPHSDLSTVRPFLIPLSRFAALPREARGVGAPEEILARTGPHLEKLDGVPRLGHPPDVTLKLSFVLVYVLILTGCFGSYVKPTSPPPQILKRTADEVLAVVSQRAQAIQQVKTLITIEIEGKRPSGFFLPSQGFQAALWAQPPRQIRLQGFNPVGGILFDLVSEDGHLKLSAPGQPDAVQMTLERLLIREGRKSSFSSLQLLDALASGGQPLIRPSEFSAVEQIGGEIILYQFLLDSDGKAYLVRKYWLESNDLLATQAVYFDPSGYPAVTVLYHDYQAIASPEGAPASPGGARGENFWPREITMNLNGRTRLVTTFHEVKLNQPFQTGAFSLGVSPQ
jgi:hypothetical protein